MGSRPPLWMRPSPSVKTSLGDYSERSRLSLAAFSFEPRAKAAKVSLDGSCRCVLCGGALRRAVIERGASSCLDAPASIRRLVQLPLCRANDPRCLVMCDWRRCHSSQRRCPINERKGATHKRAALRRFQFGLGREANELGSRQPGNRPPACSPDRAVLIPL
jgi:hypothetical protein